MLHSLTVRQAIDLGRLAHLGRQRQLGDLGIIMGKWTGELSDPDEDD